MPKLSLHVESKLRSELKERGDRCRRDTDWNQIGRADIAFLSRSALVKTYIDHGSQPSHTCGVCLPELRGALLLCAGEIRRRQAGQV
jgi:hypothetical protein